MLELQLRTIQEWFFLLKKGGDLLLPAHTVQATRNVHLLEFIKPQGAMRESKCDAKFESDKPINGEMLDNQEPRPHRLKK